jgi:hypothetical protein
MDELMTRFWSDLVGRTTTGPMTFRFVLQPLMALLYAYRDGLHDARAGRPPYFHTILTEPGQRTELLREGLKAVSRVIAFGVVIDTIYQVIVFRRIYPLELVVIVLLLAFVPYLLFRGPINRLFRQRTHA